MATPAKKRQQLSVVKDAEKQSEPTAQNVRRIALTPARRDEILDNIAVEWNETFELLERFDRGESIPDFMST